MKLIILTVVLAITGGSSLAGHSLSVAQERVLARWLASNPGHRLATVEDCNCSADLEAFRAGQGGPWTPARDYQPYAATGDFNGDGRSDFAVVVRHRDEVTAAWTLLVFNGGEGAKPAFSDKSLDFSRLALFFGPPRPKPYRLVVGAFESHGATLEPHGRSYVLKWAEY
jgi:hypothetical protein